jgi:hypothetical protein
MPPRHGVPAFSASSRALNVDLNAPPADERRSVTAYREAFLSDAESGVVRCPF